MRVGFPGGPRLEWYDRNPIGTGLNYGPAVLAPHAETTRATYTVPTGKKALLTHATAEMYRSSAAAPVSIYSIRIDNGTQDIIHLFSYNNTVDAVMRDLVGNTGVVPAGASMTIRTLESGTGGTVTYHGSLTVTEFDA